MNKITGKYGYFDPENKEYVITRPDTPRPWYNYLMNEDFISLISNTGGGMAYYKDPKVFRLLRYRFQNVPMDRPGRYIYLRDENTGDYWSATWAPTMRKDGKYQCRVGAGYQIITYELNGIETEVTYFVPPDLPLEIWDLKIKNLSSIKRKLKIFSYAEFAFWGALRDLINLDSPPSCTRIKYENNTIVHYSYNDIGTGLHDMHFVQNFGFHVANITPQGYNCNRDKFIGIYRDESNPMVVETGISTNYCGNHGQPIGSLEHCFTLMPGESKRIIYQTGFGENDDAWRKNSKKYKSEKNVDQAFLQVKEHWEKRFSAFQVNTPDPEFDAVVNSFIQYNAAVTAVLSRSLSSWQRGIMLSIGFRDSAQDQIAMVHAMPKQCRKMIINLLNGLNLDGSACHNFNPRLNSYGVTGFYDDQNWIALTVAAYVKETGELDFLDQKIRWADSEKKDTVFEHLLAAQEFSWNHRGKHGLMQIGNADWNDSLNPGDKTSESIFNCHLYGASTLALIGLCEIRGEIELAKKFQQRYNKIKELTNTLGWDGQWYKRLIKVDGELIGSIHSKYGRIFLEPQPWAVMSGFADKKKAEALLDIVEEKLGTEYGHKLIDIPFYTYDESIGAVGISPPGTKENGSVFNHAASWMIYAEALLGRGNIAYKYYKRMSMPVKNERIETYLREPYAACQYIPVSPSKNEGEGINPWLTGTAAWQAIATMQGIIGCRADYDGLIIDPSIPDSWDEFKLIRRFRDIEYHITVKNPDHVCHGVKILLVEGETMPDCKIPYNKKQKGKKVNVMVVLGKNRKTPMIKRGL